ncbi:hypothetical protein [Streptomyces sp. NPDC127197]
MPVDRQVAVRRQGLAQLFFVQLGLSDGTVEDMNGRILEGEEA